MNQATIRDVEARDIPELKAIIGAVWDWLDLIDDGHALDATLGIYLNQILHEATFGRAAVLNGKVVGPSSALRAGRNPNTACCWKTALPTR